MSNNDLEKTPSYSFTISSRIHHKIKKNLMLRKALGERESSLKDWILLAVCKKLAQEKENGYLEIGKEIQISVHLPEDINAEINTSVEFHSKISSYTFSKKKWVVDAVESLLEEDHKSLSEKFSKI